jgi:hypothetical protein
VVTQFHLMLALLVFLALWYGAFLVATYLDQGVDYWNCPGNDPAARVTILKTVGLTAVVAAGIVLVGLWLLT